MSATSFTLIASIIPLIFVGVSVYALILFILVAHRAIRALDIYIDEKRNRNMKS